MRIAGLTLALALALAAGSAIAAPQLILHHGRIVTLDDQARVVEAVAIEDGRILATGDDRAVKALAGPDTRMVDLKRRMVIPGLIDNHNHVIRATEYWRSEARLDGVTSRAAALTRLRAKAAELGPQDWLFVLGGWTEDQFIDEPKGFSLAELDAIAPKRPAFLQVGYDHAYVNSVWLKGPGSDPKFAGFIARDDKGAPTGRLDGGFAMIGAAIRGFPAVDEAAQIAGIKAMMRDMAAMGITSVYDPGGLGIRLESYQRIKALADKGELDIRLFHTLWGGLVNDEQAADRYIATINTERPFGGSAAFERIALGEVIYAPFHWDNPVAAANPGPDDIAQATRILRAAALAGWPMQIHAIQAKTIDHILDVVAAIDRDQPIRALRWTITHADHIRPDQLARARDLGLLLQIRSDHVAGGLAPIFAHFGDAAYHAPALRAIADSGIGYGFGTDGTKAAQINPFVSLWWAVTGKALNGAVISKEKLSRIEALIAHSRANADQLFREHELGAIKPGFRADLVILDRDYLNVPEDEIKDIHPTATLVGGRVVHGGV